VQRYRAFVSDGVAQGRRVDLMGGGLYRSMGGWRAVADLRRGREAYRSDERVLGSSAFVAALLEEADAHLKGRYRQVELSKLKKRIAEVLSTFLCEFLIGQFFEEWRAVIHFSYWV
jgi:putative transposase